MSHNWGLIQGRVQEAFFTLSALCGRWLHVFRIFDFCYDLKLAGTNVQEAVLEICTFPSASEVLARVTALMVDWQTCCLARRSNTPYTPRTV